MIRSVHIGILINLRAESVQKTRKKFAQLCLSIAMAGKTHLKVDSQKLTTYKNLSFTNPKHHARAAAKLILSREVTTGESLCIDWEV